jgi:hypothetical protein
MAKVRVKYLMPHGKHRHSTYGVLPQGDAAKLEKKGVVQIRGPVTDDYVEPVRPESLLDRRANQWRWQR